MAKHKRPTFPPAGYATFNRCVHLGRVSKRVIHNAKAAGLIPINAKAFRRLIVSTMTIQRISSEGTWFDTVKY